MPAPHDKLAQELLKGNYDLGFVELARGYDEMALEDAIERHMTRFLLELGEGWAFVGRQKEMATLIMYDEPARAQALFEEAIAAGDEQYATNGLGILCAKRDLPLSKKLFERSCAAGDLICAPCNLAHLLIEADPERALDLYAQSASYGETEARIGLAYLLRYEGQVRAQELLSKAKKAANRDESVRFLLEFISHASTDAALGVARFLKANGFSVADETILTFALGQAYQPRIGKVELGSHPNDTQKLTWTVVEVDNDGALLLCDEANR